MKIKHFLYNTFTIKEGNLKIAIDPGIYMKLFHMHSLIPESEWKSFSHILVTHGDPDHYAKADTIAEASDAPIYCSEALTKIIGGKNYIMAPRKGGIKNWIPFENVQAIEAGDIIHQDGLSIEGITTQHGPIYVPLLGFKVRKVPSAKERTGLGAIGYKITLNDKVIVNLGDTLFQEEWTCFKPDVLMLPIGGLGNNTWTLDMPDAIKTVKLMLPKLVIPCHYNVPFLFKKNAAPANGNEFKREVEKLGIECKLMASGDEICL